MGVLNVANQRGGPTTDSSPPPGAESTDRNASEKTVDVAERFTSALEQFLTGLVPGDFTVKLNWGLLSPIFSVLSGLATTVGAIGVLS